MLRILFVCHGNICRSTMAEYVMRDLIRREGLEDEIQADSAAATSDALGWGVHPSTQKVLRRHGVPCGDHRSCLMTRSDYDRYDLICGMDEENLSDIYRILAGKSERRWGWWNSSDVSASEADPEGKVHLILDWSSRPRIVDDPWYTNDYETAYRDILEGCKSLLAHLKAQRGLER